MEIDSEVLASRLRVSRRRALGLGGMVGLAGVLAACSTDNSVASSPSTSPSAAAATTTAASAGVDADLLTLLASAPRCVLTAEETQGPYWFDVDSIRNDIRDDRPGLQLDLALRVQDLAQCAADPATGGVANAVVEIWHCDAGGVYSGFQSASVGVSGGGGAPPGGGGPGGMPPGGAPGGMPPGGQPGGQGSGGDVSDGSYSAGNSEATPTDDATFLRGAQTTSTDGIVTFTSIFPGWYTGRAVHVHIKVHIDKKTVLTTQLFFDDVFTDGLYASTAPYNTRGKARDTRNSTDGIYSATGLAAASLQSDRALAALNLGIEV